MGSAALDERVAVRRSALIGLVGAGLWLAASIGVNIALLRFFPAQRASWSEAVTRTMFGYFGWGWLLTVAMILGVAAAVCLLLQWARPAGRSLVWAVPLAVTLPVTLLDGLTRVATHTQWASPADAAEAAREANVASLSILAVVSVTSTVLGVFLAACDTNQRSAPG